MERHEIGEENGKYWITFLRRLRPNQYLILYRCVPFPGIVYLRQLAKLNTIDVSPFYDINPTFDGRSILIIRQSFSILLPPTSLLTLLRIYLNPIIFVNFVNTEMRWLEVLIRAATSIILTRLFHYIGKLWKLYRHLISTSRVFNLTLRRLCYTGTIYSIKSMILMRRLAYTPKIQSFKLILSDFPKFTAILAMPYIEQFSTDVGHWVLILLN